MGKRAKSRNHMTVALDASDVAQFKQSLTALGERVVPVAKKALGAASRIVVKATRQGAPKVTRRLANSIGSATRTYRNRGGWGEAVTVVSFIGPTKAAGGKYPRYAHLVEFGTKPHWQNFAPMPGGMVLQHWQHPGAKPKSFLRPAFEANKTAALNAIAAELEKGIKAL